MSFKNGMLQATMAQITDFIRGLQLSNKNDISLVRDDISRVDDKTFAIQQQAAEILIKLNSLLAKYNDDIPILKAKDFDPNGILDILEPQHLYLIAMVDQIKIKVQKLIDDSCCLKEAFGRFRFHFVVKFVNCVDSSNNPVPSITQRISSDWLKGDPSLYKIVIASDGVLYNNLPFKRLFLQNLDSYSGNTEDFTIIGASYEIVNNTAEDWRAWRYQVEGYTYTIEREDGNKECELATLIKELFEDLNFKLDAEQELNFNAPLVLERYEGAWTNYQENLSLTSKNDALIKTYTELVKVGQDLNNFKQLLNFYQYPVEIDENTSYSSLTDLILNSGGGGDLSRIEKILGVELDEDNKVKPLGIVPKSLLNIPSQKSNITINNYSDLLIWIIRQLDALIGEFPIEIKIKDADLTEEGDQTVTLKIGNLAEGIAELFGFVFQGATMNDASLQILLRLIPEITRIRQIGLTTQDIVVANREFLGYREKEVEKKIKSNFTLVKNFDNIAKMLEPENQKYKSIKLDPKAESLFDYLTRFQYIASLMKTFLVKSPDEFNEFLKTQAEQEEVNLDDWNAFLQTINDPTSFFNLDEKASRVRDVEGD